MTAKQGNFEFWRFIEYLLYKDQLEVVFRPFRSFHGNDDIEYAHNVFCKGCQI